ncbi:hypothetical protein KGF56_003057 [Candida oxycetoniae]|uniref:N-acetyltransferase domain-containing protein n=1 Tax=Candida oxycetoniae TaxID=497107 RepID=A0AAI9SWB3_9ASCO|nr:uncharacterized protein KGF56_003057 [Candida oxycetoniae]KAI3404157.2 hypothetical protein KGF56_003057 [Candida oxycetoniae]
MIDSKFQFKSTQDPEKIKELFSLCGTQWGGPLTPEEFGTLHAETLLQYRKDGGKIIPFYIEDSTSKVVVACTIIKFLKALYKPADKSSLISSTPDPASFGVRNITAILVSYVFTHKDYRKQGLAESCISQAIAATEDEIIKEKLASSNDADIDNFKKMTLDDYTGQIDKSLATYYLGKEYIWILYSGVNTYYRRFGFKSYPLDFYQIPVPILTEGQESLIEHLIKDAETGKQASPDTKSHQVGKRIKLLNWDNKEDRGLIDYILQTKELAMLSELNKLVFHTDLQSDHRSHTSLTNMSSILAMSKPGSVSGGGAGELSAIEENSGGGTQENHINKPSGDDQSTRKSLALNQTVSKFSIKPCFDDYKTKVIAAQGVAKTEKSKEHCKIQGVILTNDLQRKSYYVLWNVLKGEFFITGMGEISYENVLPGTFRRRGSSFTGLNDLGGFNFQDLDILISAAVYNAKNRSSVFKEVFVATTDLPSEVPDPVLYDFFLNYLPMSSYASEEHRLKKEDERAKGEEKNKVEFIINGAERVGVLPMVRQFGNASPEFELDWLENGMWCWG